MLGCPLLSTNRAEACTVKATIEHFPCPPLQVTMLGFAGTLKWQKSPGEGLLVTLPCMPPSPQSGWALKLEGVK